MNVFMCNLSVYYMGGSKCYIYSGKDKEIMDITKEIQKNLDSLNLDNYDEEDGM